MSWEGVSQTDDGTVHDMKANHGMCELLECVIRVSCECAVCKRDVTMTCVLQ